MGSQHVDVVVVIVVVQVVVVVGGDEGGDNVERQNPERQKVVGVEAEVLILARRRSLGPFQEDQCLDMILEFGQL